MAARRSAMAAWAMILASTALGDRGSIPFKPNVQIFEPNQRAMIAWNGEEEILLLSTDLRASEPTKVLEVLPLPSEPQVKKGDVEVFRRATALINRKTSRPRKVGGRGGAFGTPETAPPAGEVTFHEKIGAHDISVTHVLDGQRFVEWVQNYLKGAGVENPVIPAPLREVVNEYLADGFRWFVFDVVELGTKVLTNDAIQYRFKSDRVYYPMRITRAEAGETSVELLVLTPRLLRQFPGIPVDQVRLRHEPVSISSAELAGLNAEMDALLAHRNDMKLRIWSITGMLSSFKHDLVAR